MSLSLDKLPQIIFWCCKGAVSSYRSLKGTRVNEELESKPERFEITLCLANTLRYCRHAHLPPKQTVAFTSLLLLQLLQLSMDFTHRLEGPTPA